MYNLATNENCARFKLTKLFKLPATGSLKRRERMRLGYFMKRPRECIFRRKLTAKAEEVATENGYNGVKSASNGSRR